MALVVWIAVGLAAFFVLRPMYQKYRFGALLADMTSIVERREGIQAYLGPEAYGSQYGLPSPQGLADTIAFERGLASLSRKPRHVVTRELVKNSMVAESFGRPERVAAIGLLLEILISRGIALGAEDFLKSYS